MPTYLTPVENSLAFVLPQELQEQWGLDATTPLDVRSSEQGIIIIPLTRREKSHSKSIDDVIAIADAQYAETFRRLAE